MHADHHFFSFHPTTNDLYAWHDCGLDVQAVQFIDLQGKIIDQIHVREQKVLKNNVQNYARGIYFVKVLHCDQWHEFKFIKK